MLNDDIMAFMANSHNKSSLLDIKPDTIKSDIREEEALQIFNELIEVYRKHNVSYSCACRLSVSLTHALLTGAAELYAQEE